MFKIYDAVIVANGEFPSHEVPLEVLEHAEHVIACDGAIYNVPEADAVVGDGDSVPDAFRDRMICLSEQEDNDLTKATRYCLQQGWKRIAFLGATGGREDHTLGNISLLMRYFREMDIEGILFTDWGYFTPCHGNRVFDSRARQQVSLFNFGCSTLRSKGLKWDSYAYQELWQGTLNEALGSQFTIHADGYYLVYQTYETK